MPLCRDCPGWPLVGFQRSGQDDPTPRSTWLSYLHRLQAINVRMNTSDSMVGNVYAQHAGHSPAFAATCRFAWPFGMRPYYRRVFPDLSRIRTMTGSDAFINGFATTYRSSFEELPFEAVPLLPA